mgnify:CR=1 FL=1
MVPINEYCPVINSEQFNLEFLNKNRTRSPEVSTDARIYILQRPTGQYENFKTNSRRFCCIIPDNMQSLSSELLLGYLRKLRFSTQLASKVKVAHRSLTNTRGLSTLSARLPATPLRPLPSRVQRALQLQPLIPLRNRQSRSWLSTAGAFSCA